MLCFAQPAALNTLKFDFEVDGVILHNVKALRCPACEEELFTPQQYDVIRKKIIDSTEL